MKAVFILSVLLLSHLILFSGENRNSGDLLTREEASRLAALPLKCMQKAYPNKPGQTLASPEEIKAPDELHPAFYGCYDWHSSVHGHWLLVKLLRLFPGISNGEEVRRKLAENISASNILKEAEYFRKPLEKSFERTYGWAWLLKLAEELNTWDDPLARTLEANLMPLTNQIVKLYIDFLPKLNYPVRVGEHPNTAFGLAFAWDYAHTTGNDSLKILIEKRASDFYMRDEDCPLSWEPGGTDFLSPCLEEADLMRRVLPLPEFRSWLLKFLPSIADPDFILNVGVVSDRSDGKLVHLDGLNFSRAWCLSGIASLLPEYKHLEKIASQHMLYSLPSITDGGYEGEHWLASFALLALISME